MAKKKLSKKERREALKTKAQEKQVIYWAVGITLILLVLSYFLYKSRM